MTEGNQPQPRPHWDEPGMFSAPRGATIGRRRTAPRAERTSDVRRFSGILVASVFAALAVKRLLQPAWEETYAPQQRLAAEA